jgi:hypothetical protein
MTVPTTLESIRAEMVAFMDIFNEFEHITNEDRDQDRKEIIALFGIYMSSIKQR